MRLGLDLWCLPILPCLHRVTAAPGYTRGGGGGGEGVRAALPADNTRRQGQQRDISKGGIKS